MMPTLDRADAPADVLGLLNDLDKYAGWLGRGAEPTRVRDAVKLLAVEFERGCDTRDAVDALEREVGKMAPSQVGTLLRKAVRSFRVALDACRALPLNC